MSPYRHPYVEASVFIAYIKGEMKGPAKDQNARQIFDSILDAAKSGAFQIVTSALTIAEVYKKKGEPEALTDEESESLLPHFREDYIVLVEVDRGAAERANDLCRISAEKQRRAKKGGSTDLPALLRPNDAIHVACAEKGECDVILSYDANILNQQALTIPPEMPKAMEKAAPGKALQGIQEPLQLSDGNPRTEQE